MTLFFICWGLWLAFEIIINRVLWTKENKDKNYDKGSTASIWRVIGIANTLAVIAALFIKLSISQNSIVPYIGLVVLGIGILARIYAISVLGKLFTVNVNISEGHHLFKRGIYRIIRHPAYLGSILSFIGFGLSLNNWISLLIVSIAITAVIIHRINIEEKALLERFGEEYEQYRNNSYRLIPYVY
jgi:protein-S-isoprenylcysteine O-methyltransferase Ste14